jgi:NADH-quinone oxidoreductase subunit D
MKYDMESLIIILNSFRVDLDLILGGLCISEAPKGEFGVLLFLMDKQTVSLSNRAPGFYHLHGIEHMSKGQKLADVVTILGT